ncbi:hypothetical protein DMUE_3252, partial [Dictyocoela muelleri]
YFNALINSIAYDIVGENSNDILSTNIKDAIILSSIAWDDVSRETIMNCFNKRLIENLTFASSTKEEMNHENLSETVIEEVFEEAEEFEKVEVLIESPVENKDKDVCPNKLYHILICFIHLH